MCKRTLTHDLAFWGLKRSFFQGNCKRNFILEWLYVSCQYLPFLIHYTKIHGWVLQELTDGGMHRTTLPDVTQSPISENTNLTSIDNIQ